MSEKSRIFGNNLAVFLKQNNVSVEEFAKQTGYSEQEIQRIMGGRIFLFQKERREIADFLGVSIEEMFKDKGQKFYESAGCFGCIGEFSSNESKKKIFDIFDTYCDIQEILQQEGLKSL